MRSVLSVHVHLLTEHTKQNNNVNEQTKIETVPYCTNTDTGNNHPQLKSETRLPKDGSQSGTTIDSCL